MNDNRSDLTLRAVSEKDRPGVISLIESVYQEYGERICLENADSDLLSLPQSYVDKSGVFLVLATPNDEILGTHAILPNAYGQGVATFRRLYLAPALRGSQWGVTLMQSTVDLARELKQHRIEFWSDVRFKRAHAFFRKFDFQSEGGQRTMNDGFEPYHEISFYLDLS